MVDDGSFCKFIPFFTAAGSQSLALIEVVVKRLEIGGNKQARRVEEKGEEGERRRDSENVKEGKKGQDLDIEKNQEKIESYQRQDLDIKKEQEKVEGDDVIVKNDFKDKSEEGKSEEMGLTNNLDLVSFVLSICPVPNK